MICLCTTQAVRYAYPVFYRYLVCTLHPSGNQGVHRLAASELHTAR